MREAIGELRSELEGVRIVLAAMGPKMCQLAGADYDGVFFNWMTPEFAASAREHVEAGASEAGRERAADVRLHARRRSAATPPSGSRRRSRSTAISTTATATTSTASASRRARSVSPPPIATRPRRRSPPTTACSTYRRPRPRQRQRRGHDRGRRSRRPVKRACVALVAARDADCCARPAPRQSHPLSHHGRWFTDRTAAW